MDIFLGRIVSVAGRDVRIGDQLMRRNAEGFFPTRVIDVAVTGDHTYIEIEGGLEYQQPHSIPVLIADRTQPAA